MMPVGVVSTLWTYDGVIISPTHLHVHFTGGHELYAGVRDP